MSPEGRTSSGGIEGWKPRRAAENDNEVVDTTPLQQQGPEADAVRQEMHAVMAELLKRQAVTPEVHDPEVFAANVRSEIAAAEDGTRQTRTARGTAIFDNRYDALIISEGEHLPGYALMADMVREDVAAEEANIPNLDEARKRARKSFGVE